jgi:hypothetical protein
VQALKERYAAEYDAEGALQQSHCEFITLVCLLAIRLQVGAVPHRHERAQVGGGFCGRQAGAGQALAAPFAATDLSERSSRGRAW